MEINNLSSAQRSASYPSGATQNSADLRAQDESSADNSREEQALRADRDRASNVERTATPSASIPRGSLVDIAV